MTDIELDPQGNRNSRLKARIIAVLVIFILILAVLFAAAGIVMLSTPPPVDIGLITVDILDREANITVELELDDDIDIGGSSLVLQYSDREIPVSIDGHEISATVSIIEFRDMIELRSVNITGDLVASSSLPFEIRDTLRKEIDLSFLADIGDEFEVTKMNTTIHSLSMTKARIEFTVDMEREIHLIGEDTEATLYTSLNSFECDVEDVEIRPDGSGDGSILVPTSAIILLSISTQNVTLEFWGLSFSFPFSISG